MSLTIRAVRRRFLAWLVTTLTVVYGVTLLWLTHAPNISPPSLGPFGDDSDKVIHFFAYGGLAFLVMLVLKAWKPQATVMRGAIIALVVVAAVDELTQPLTLRHADWLDWVANSAGIIVGATAMRFIVTVASQWAAPADS